MKHVFMQLFSSMRHSYFTHKVSYERRTYGYLGYELRFRKDSGKSPKNSLKVAFCVCKLKFGSLVALLSIVLTQSCMNYEQ